MDYVLLLNFTSFKLVALSVISYFICVHLLKPALHFIHMVIHYHGFHYYPKSLLLGHLETVWPNYPVHLEFKELSRNFGKYYAKFEPTQYLTIFWLSILPVIIASGHQAVERILNKTNLKKPRFYKFLGLRTGLITSEPGIWKVRRKLIEPFFATKKLKVYSKYMYEEVKSFSDKLNEEVEKPVDLVHHIHSSTLNIILKSTASIPLDDRIEDKERFTKIISEIERNCITRMPNLLYQFDWLFKFFPFSKVYYKALKDGRKFCEEIFIRREELLKRSPSNEPEDQDLVHLLGDKIGKQELIDELMTLVSAGYDTTAIALRLLLFNLGNHLDVQEKLHQEIVENFPDDTPIDDVDKINQCSYLDQCLKESLRLNPTVACISKLLEEDVMVKDKKLLKGSHVVLWFQATHHDPNVYPNPEKYDPDRWSPENASKIPRASFVPFSYGPRMCIGYRYAMIELKIYVAQIIRKFSFVSTRKHGSISFLYGITSQPASPLEIILTPRNNNQ